MFRFILPLSLTLALFALYATAAPGNWEPYTLYCPTLNTDPTCKCSAEGTAPPQCLGCVCIPSSPLPALPSSSTAPPTGTPVNFRSSTPTCPPGPFKTTPVCIGAICEPDGTIINGDSLCKSLCSCPTPSPQPAPASSSPLPPAVEELHCGNSTLSDNPNLPQGSKKLVSEWCKKPEVSAVCEDGKVVVQGSDTLNVCKPLCRCKGT
ncbi:MAG: hypothetical protein LQ338_006911 [Usnochroma carphineum]|nr:MAG: hypothetical protein LQ338_006911 [Usnochroma carphineum]